MKNTLSARKRIKGRLLVAVLCIVGYFGQPASAAVTNLPTTLTGGTVSDIHYNDTSAHAVARGGTLDVGGFSAFGGSITSVYLFVEWAVDAGYDGTNALQLNGVDTSIVPADGDGARHTFIDITAGSFGIDTSGEITSLSVTFYNSDNGAGDSVHFDYIYLVINPTLPIHMPPTWSDEFDGTGQADPAVWTYEEGYQRNNEDQYYQVGATNGWQENGEFIIEAREESVGGYNYSSASIRSINNYSWMYGRAQIRAKIPATAGMWPAIWTVGDVGEWPYNGECDIMEYYGEKILANGAVGSGARWTAKWDGANRTLASLEAVDPNWRNEYHIWTMQWDESAVRLYVDNILINTINQSWLVNSGSYGGSPSEPFKQPHNIWLNLAVGGNSGGNPAAPTYPQRYCIDYWRVWEGDTDNVAPTDIALSSNAVNEGLSVGTVVGALSAMDADPAEVIRYSLVSGTGSDDNADFEIPEFVSDSTTAGLLKTAAPLAYADGATRSIRVRATDIEGATYDKIFTINLIADPTIYLSTNSFTISEGSSSNLFVRLLPMPDNTVTVNVTRASGDTDLAISVGSELTFTPVNGTNWQQVTISAYEDADTVNGSATFLVEDAAGGYASNIFDVAESENDFDAPAVSNYNATAISSVSADISGWVVSGGVVQAWICWGANDGGTLSTSDWQNVVSFGTLTVDTNFTANITGLATNATYWYRCYVTNISGTAWSDAATFSGTPFSGGDAGSAGAPVAGAYFEWDAGQNPGPATSWPSTTTNTYDWVFDNPAGNKSAVSVDDTRFNLLTDAYEFPDARDENNTTWDGLGAEDATFEFVLDIDTDNGIIFESGGQAIGTQFDVSGGTLRWCTQNGGASTVSYPLVADDTNRFIHVVLVADLNNSLQLYVDDAMKQSTNWSKGDWCGSDPTGFGDSNSTKPNGDPGGFTGKVALFRYYRGKAFTAAEVSKNFAALSTASIVANTAPTGVSDTQATLNGSLNALGTNYTVDVFWGPNDGGTNAGSWTNNMTLGSLTNVSTNISYSAIIATGQTNYYTFRASNTGTTGWATPSWQFVALGSSSISTPTGLSATPVSTNQIDLNWTDNSTNETGFLVERSGTGGSNFTAVGTAAMDGTNYTDNSVSPGLTYYYRVSATNATESGVPSAEAWATALKMSTMVTLGSLTHTYDGNSCTATVTTVPAGLACDITYNGGTALPTNVASYSVVATVNEVSYQGTTNGILVVSKGTPIVSVWPIATSIEDGQALSNSVLTGGSASAGGNFAFETPSQSPSIGTNAVSVIFSSTDSANYNSVTGTVDVIVTDALIPATVILSNLAQTYDSNAVTATVTTIPAGLAVTVTYDGSLVAPTNVGSYAVTGTVVEAGYQGTTNGTLVVSKSTPTVSLWPTASAIVVGQAVSNATLSGGSPSVAGSFSYDTPTATPGVGTNAMDVIFTPIDGANYNSITSTVDVTVLPLPPSAPTGLIATGSPGQVDLTWQASAGATGYNVKRSSTQGGPYSTVGSPTTTNYSDSVSNGQVWCYVVSAVNTGGEGSDSSEATATLPHTLPFLEDFEGLSEGDWGSQNLWSATNASVQTNLMFDTKAGSITSETGYARQDFAGTDTNVWADMEIQPVFCTDDLTPPFADATASMYFNTNGNPVVYDGTNLVTCSGKVITTGSWVRVTIHSDYTAKTWDLYIDTDLVASNLGFYSEAVTKFETLDVRGGAQSAMAVDDIGATVDSPFVQHSLTVISDHGTALPSGVSMYASNSLVNATMTTPTVLDANTNIQYVCTGWAATGSLSASGNETNVSFNITNDTTVTWQWQTNYWVDLDTVGN